ncbi:hypothetical protein WA026_003044 [Henosepilachna vigintioctopunctata]|uniref:Uncharacterized protein n=1 Tax=Henosepilachna vigintioctopunctata TaxID=420089 RepID=A0AAW1TH33_9CUCU
MTPREQRMTRKKWKNYSLNYRQRKQLLKQTTDNFISQNTPPPIEDEIKPIVNEAITHVINEDRRAKEAKRRSEWQRKSRNMEIKKMKAIVSKLKTKLNTHRQKYKRVKKQLKKSSLFEDEAGKQSEPGDTRAAKDDNIPEHWFNLESVVLASIPGYTLAAYFCRTVKGHGGTCIYVKSGCDFKKISVADFSVEVHCECCAIKFALNNKKVAVVCVYRSPTGEYT